MAVSFAHRVRTGSLPHPQGAGLLIPSRTVGVGDSWTASSVRVADVHVSHLSRKNRLLPTRATEERAKPNTFRTHSSQRVPLGGGSCLRRTGHPFAVSGFKGLHRRLSLCSLPVPKQSEGSLWSLISVAQSANCRTWQPAGCVILLCFSPGGLGRRGAVVF